MRNLCASNKPFPSGKLVPAVSLFRRGFNAKKPSGERIGRELEDTAGTLFWENLGEKPAGTKRMCGEAIDEDLYLRLSLQHVKVAAQPLLSVKESQEGGGSGERPIVIKETAEH